MPPESSETQTIKIPKKWFGMVSGAVSFLLVIAGVVTKGCEYHKEQILREEAMQRRLEKLEKWRCAMGSKPQDSATWPKTDWQRKCE